MVLALPLPRVLVFVFSHVFNFIFNPVIKAYLVQQCGQLAGSQVQSVLGEGRAEGAENAKSHIARGEDHCRGKRAGALRACSLGWIWESELGHCTSLSWDLGKFG